MTHELSVRLTASEYATLRRLAELRGLTPQDMARELMQLPAEHDPEPRIRAIRERRRPERR
jgi:hypothetical protein